MIRKILFLLLVVLSLGIVSAAAFNNPSISTSSLDYQYTNPTIGSMYSSSDISLYWPQLAEDMQNGKCEGSSDFLVMIPPGGCSPAVVRSDLLAEQNVPVFCQLESVQINPLIKVSSIKSISFQGQYPADIAGVSFYPARAALRSYTTLLSSPVANNIGYAVIVLKKKANESSQAKNISGNLTATMYYDADKAFGVGSSEFYLQVMDNNKWSTNAVDQTFWNGRGLLRLEDVQNDQATVDVLTQDGRTVRTVKLRVGETSNEFYFPGFYCQAGMKLKLNSIATPDDSVLLDIDGVQVEARLGTRLINDRCTVKSLDVSSAESGSVKIVCSGLSKTLDLSLASSFNANFSIDNNIVTRVPGDVVSTDPKTGDKLYLAYAGYTKKAIGTMPDKNAFVVLVKDSKIIDKGIYSQLAKQIDNTFNGSITELGVFERAIKVGSYSSADKNMFVLYKADESGLNSLESLPAFSGVSFNGFVDLNAQNTVSLTTTDQQKTLVDSYFNSADQAVNDILTRYPSASDNNVAFGEKGLVSEIELINQIQQSGFDYNGKRIELMNKFLELYPSSAQASWVQQQLSIAQRTNSANAYRTVYVNNDYHNIGVVRFRPADISGKSVEFLVDGIIPKQSSTNSPKWYEGETINLSLASGNKNNDYFIIKKIDSTRVTVDYYKTKYDNAGKAIGSDLSESGKVISYGENSDGTSMTQKFLVGSYKNTAAYYIVSLNGLNVDKVAYVSLVSDLKTMSQANFTYNIGIEQRAIKLSPEKATEEADALNKTIKDWESKNAALGSLVEKWKGVCLATGLALQIKNFIEGTNGKSFARQKVMAAYRTQCQTNGVDNVTQKKYNEESVDVCYNSLSGDIEKDVDAYAAAVTSVNDKIEKTYKNDLGVFQTSGDCSMTINGNTVTAKNITSWSDARQCLLNQELKNSAGTQMLKNNVNTATENQLRSLSESVASEKEAASIISGLPAILKDTYVPFVQSGGGMSASNFNINSAPKVIDNESLVKIVSNPTSEPFKTFIGSGSIGVFTTYTNNQWYIIIKKSDGSGGWVGNSQLIRDFTIDNGMIKIGDHDVISPSKGVTVVVNANTNSKCVYNFTHPIVRYYDTNPNKGMPAIAPVDLKNGWYIYVPQSQGGVLSDNVKGYQTSGAVQFYYLCNIGPNGIVDNMGGDDICQSFNINNYQNVDAFTGCSISKLQIQSLAKKAEDVVRQVASQYKDGIRSVSIQGVGDNIPVDAGMSGNADAYQCQDFMSPDDCKIMYNVCDPVICPTSRCNFGGKMPVANVIQSGIVGSMVLCLPNSMLVGGDVLIPVCLTGIHAGIEGYISILKSQQQCLQEYAKTGKHVGICDEMTAVYKCEFFWRQAAPLLQNIIPNLFEFAYTGKYNKQSGGGEYATFQASWDNMQKSLDYFKNTYASTSFAAFKFGDVQSMGTQFCQNFIGTSLPTSGSALDALLKPESPVQFYGKFSEIPYTDVTVPATSQYKVYYHIYAGTDQGTMYMIYLKNPPATSYYQTAQSVVVKQGYISVGQQVDESVDFTSPAGYKEMCIVLNNQEQCGFNSVSTEFTINVLNDLYVKDQAGTNNISTEKECIQGSPSLLALANTNIQEGTQEAASPDISLNGINRVCATKNPGLGTNSAKWQAVGYCGVKNLTCWLDTSSINNNTLKVLGRVGSITDAEAALTGTYTETQQATMAQISDIKTNQIPNMKIKINGLLANANSNNQAKPVLSQDSLNGVANPVLNNITKAIESANLDAHVANLLFLRYQAYEVIAKAILGLGDPRSAISASAATTAVAPVVTTTNTVSNSNANAAIQSGLSWQEEVKNNFKDSTFKKNVLITISGPNGLNYKAVFNEGTAKWVVSGSPVTGLDLSSANFIDGVIKIVEVSATKNYEISNNLYSGSLQSDNPSSLATDLFTQMVK